MTGDRPTSAAATDAQPRSATIDVLAVVGTDHHRFDRLIGWLDDWIRDKPVPPRVVVQHGSSGAPRLAEGAALIPHDRLQLLMSSAAVVVTHGGPATIMEVRQLGRRPVVVPRDPALGEHVDGHQQRFARRVAAADLVTLCETREALVAALDAAAHDPSAFRLDPATVGAGGDATAVAVATAGRVLDDLIASGRQRRRR